MSLRVLCVCEGNVCRSPMAAALLRRTAPSVSVVTAGLSARSGEPAQSQAIALMRAHGMDLSAHRAKSLTALLCAQSDLLLTMDRGQKHEIERRFPGIGGKVFTLTSGAIIDPYRRGDEAFRQCLLQLVQAIEDWRPRLRALTKMNQ